jgi:hypothetical protein
LIIIGTSLHVGTVYGLIGEFNQTDRPIVVINNKYPADFLESNVTGTLFIKGESDVVCGDLFQAIGWDLNLHASHR